MAGEAQTGDGGGPARSLVLVELVSRVQLRTHYARLFPYFLGFSRAAGVPACWLSVGAGTGAVGAGERAGGWELDLGDEDLARLAARVAEARPTHLLVNESLSRRVREALERAAPGARRLSATDQLEVPGWERAQGDEGGPEPLRERQQRLARVGWFARWLGVACAEPEAYFVDAAPPAYDAAVLNEAVRWSRRPLAILGRVTCDYARPLAENPAFRGTDLSEASRQHGCAFCTLLVVPMCAASTDPMAAARRQLAALKEAGRGGRDLGHYEFLDVRVLRRLEELAAVLEELGTPPATLYFHPRVDDVLGAREALERALPRLARAGHRLHVMRVGVESFSAAENERFNKGVTPAQVDAFLALLARWDREWPGLVECTRQLGMIVFTPWTTLEDARQSIEGALARGFEPTSLWLCSTLELDRRSPLAALARRDGDLLVPAFEDPAMLYALSAECSYSDDLLPWRFRDRRTAVLHAVTTRLVAAGLRDALDDAVLAADPVYREITGACERWNVSLPAARLALRAIEVLGREPEPPAPAELARRLLEQARAEGLPPARSVLASLDQSRPLLARLGIEQHSRAGTLGFRPADLPDAVLFTPWTTLDDLEAVLARARELGMRPDSHFAASRLRVLPDGPFAELACREGLALAPGEPMPAPGLGGCAGPFDAEELAWRFREPATALVHAVVARVVRAERAEAPTDDPLVRALLPLPEPERAAAALLGPLAAAAREGPPPAGEEELVARLLRARGLAPPPPPPVAPPPAPAAGRVAALLARLAQDPAAPLRGFAPQAVAGDPGSPGWDEARVALQRGAEKLELVLRPAGGFPSPFVRTAHLCAVFHREAPADTREKAAVARLVVQALERAFFEAPTRRAR